MLKYFQYKIPSIFVKLIRVLLIFLCDMFFIATVNILLAVAKYSLSQQAIAQEYPSTNTSVFNLGIIPGIGAIILLVILYILTSIYNAGSCEIRQPLDERVSTAKSSVRIDQLSTLIHLSNSLLYFVLGYNYYEPYLLILLVLYGYLTLYYTYYLPFYSYHLNLVKSFHYIDSILFILAL